MASSATLDRAAGENAGGYAITLGNLSAGRNYDDRLSTPPVTLTITKKAASVTAADKSKVYGSDDPELTTSDSGFLAADLGAAKIAFSASRGCRRVDVGGPTRSRPAASDAAQPSATTTSRYNSGQLTITKKAITVAADDKTKVYGSADPELTVSVPDGALESGDTLSGDLERAAGKDVGSYAITKGEPDRPAATTSSRSRPAPSRSPRRRRR